LTHNPRRHDLRRHDSINAAAVSQESSNLGAENCLTIFYKQFLRGYEIMHLKKGQIEKVEKGAIKERVKFIAEIFGVAA
jgi:hypothetical protein